MQATNNVWLRTLETIFLVAAIGLLIPVVPSIEQGIDLMPAAAFSTILFAASRYIRWRIQTFANIQIIAESAVFFLVAWLINQVANML